MEFFIGFIFGGMMGFFIAALCEVAKDKDDDDDNIKIA